MGSWFGLEIREKLACLEVVINRFSENANLGFEEMKQEFPVLGDSGLESFQECENERSRLDDDTDLLGIDAKSMDAKALYYYFSVNVNDRNKRIIWHELKEEIIEDHRSLIKRKLKGCTNPDILVSETGNIIFKDTRNNNRVNSGTQAKYYDSSE